MQLIFDWVCQFSPAIGASALGVAGLVAVVLWRGGTIETIKIPGLVDVKLKEPIVFSGSRIILYVGMCAFVGAMALGAVQASHSCARCDGLPGETAWIYAGEFDGSAGIFKLGPFVASEIPGTATQDIPEGSWIKLLDARRTMILDYVTKGLERSMDSPFELNGKISYTCRTLPIGQRLYIADKRINGPKPDDRHIWFRVRLTPPG